MGLSATRDGQRRMDTRIRDEGAGGAAALYCLLHPSRGKSREKSGQDAMDVVANCRDSSKAKVHAITE